MKTAKLLKEQQSIKALREKEDKQNGLVKSKNLEKLEELLARENLTPRIQKYVIWNDDLDVARLVIKCGWKFSEYLTNLIKTRASNEMKAILNIY